TAEPAEKPKPSPDARWALRRPIRWLPVVGYYLLVRPALLIMSNPTIIGRERLKDVRGPVLIICNHTTRSDIGFIQAALPVRIRFHLAPAMQGEMLRETRYPPRQWFFLRRWWEPLQYLLIAAILHGFPLPPAPDF